MSSHFCQENTDILWTMTTTLHKHMDMFYWHIEYYIDDTQTEILLSSSSTKLERSKSYYVSPVVLRGGGRHSLVQMSQSHWERGDPLGGCYLDRVELACDWPEAVVVPLSWEKPL